MDSVKTVHIWSDGPSSQFKNWYITTALPWLQAETDIQIDWNFLQPVMAKTLSMAMEAQLNAWLEDMLSLESQLSMTLFHFLMLLTTKLKSKFSMCQQLK